MSVVIDISKYLQIKGERGAEAAIETLVADAELPITPATASLGYKNRTIFTAALPFVWVIGHFDDDRVTEPLSFIGVGMTKERALCDLLDRCLFPEMNGDTYSRLQNALRVTLRIGLLDCTMEPTASPIRNPVPVSVPLLAATA